jgi:protein-glutamine gamma-glutamyltransferase
MAMRVRFEGPEPQRSEFYFRGPVLSTFDGREWMPLQPSFAQALRPPTDLQVSGPAIRYEITLEPHKRPWLLLLDAATDAPAVPGFSTRMTPDLQWLTNGPVTEIVRYTAVSYPQFQHGPLQPVAGLQDYLNLPNGFNPRTQQLANELRRQTPQANAQALITTVLDRLRTGGYGYTLEPGVFGTHSADEFWFDRKQGFCEHIASSFVILMRALGIPARIVTGYQGGERNSIDNFWIVRQSDAHAWTEVWLAGQGWVRVDPTAAVAPARTGSLQRLQIEPGVIATAINTLSPGLSVNLRAIWEAVNNRWDQIILNYTQNKQLELLRNIGFESPSWEDLGRLLLACVVLASLGGAAWTLWEKRQHDPWLRLLHSVHQRLVRAGLPAPAGATPRELAHLLQAAPPSLALKAQTLRDCLLRLEVLRYAPVSNAAGKLELSRLRREFQRMSWTK